MVPMLALRDLATSLAVPLGEGRGKNSIDDALNKAVERVLQNQRRDGSFGLWPDSREADPWVTTFALFGLGEAKERGMNIPAEVFTRGIDSLKPTLDVSSEKGSEDALGQAAFTLDVLATLGKPDLDRMKKLADARARLPLFARALLLHALAISGHSTEPIATSLRADIEGAIRVEGKTAAVKPETQPHGIFDSEVRTTAMALRALLALDKAHPLASPLARPLIEARRGRSYRTTHDAAWALLALDAFRRAFPAPNADLDARVFLGNTLLAEQHLGGPALRKTVDVPMADLIKNPSAPLTFEALGGNRLFYEVVLHYSREDMPAEPVDAGFFVTKTFRNAATLGGPSSAAEATAPAFTPGDLVLCEVEVVATTPHPFVVIEDPLPGGLEPMKRDERSMGAWLAKLESTPAERREMRDDRVVYFVDHLPAGITRFRYLARAKHVGRFLAPPTRAEEMYDPDTYGRTAGTFVRIAPAAK